VKETASDRSSRASGNGRPPSVWILQGHRAGDNLQVQALADGLGWPWQSKRLTWRKSWHKRLPRWTPFYGRSASLKHLTQDAQTAFQSPWPDIVVSVGWRSVPIARWIKAQCGARLVHIGRPRAPLSYFDLVLTTPQYRLPVAKNVVHLAGPLNTLPPETLATSAKTWRGRFAELPRPWTAVLVGGDTPTLKFPASAAIALADVASTHAATSKGSLIVVTSPRTSEQVTQVLRDKISSPSFLHQWVKDAENPYAATLAMADQFIVTNDSISMTQEAALTGRPLYSFPLIPEENRAERAFRAIDLKLRKADTAIARTYLNLIRNGVIYPPKSPSDYFQQLEQSGRSMTLENLNATSAPAQVQSENERAVQAVRALFAPENNGTYDKG